MPDSSCAAALEPVMASVKPRSLLALGPFAQADLPALAPAVTLTLVESPPWLQSVAQDARFDLVFIAGVVETLAKPEAVRLLARLRDVHTQRLYVRIALGAGKDPWTANDFIALGMEEAAAWKEAGQLFHLYKFDLFTYKPAPEWFNAKYWAHPELWDKYPWLPS